MNTLNLTIGIRKENKNNWERRTALTPESCKSLIEQGMTVIVEPCSIRCYTDYQYEEIGCKISADLTSADIIVGVKEVLIDKLLPEKTYIFFSHTFKGQSYNMGLLKSILDKKIRLVDYELIKNSKGERLVAFGRYAGIVGACDILSGLGRFLLMKSLYTPFLHVSMTYNYKSFEKMMKEIKLVGQEIQIKRFPKKLCPIIFGITGGKGRVAQGAIEVLKQLPHEFVSPEDLPGLVESKGSRDRIYILELTSSHLYKKGDEPFDKEDFYANPKLYKSIFASTLLPYLSVFVHAMFWDKKAPKVVVKEEVQALAKESKLRLLGGTDITCDPDGSSDLFVHQTEVEEPFYSIDPISFETTFDLTKATKNGILYQTVDHLPCELPIESSNHFSKCLEKYLPEMNQTVYPSDFEEQILPQEIKKAIIANNGKLAPGFEYLVEKMKAILGDNL